MIYYIGSTVPVVSTSPQFHSRVCFRSKLPYKPTELTPDLFSMPNVYVGSNPPNYPVFQSPHISSFCSQLEELSLRQDEIIHSVQRRRFSNVNNVNSSDVNNNERRCVLHR